MHQINRYFTLSPSCATSYNGSNVEITETVYNNYINYKLYNLGD